MLFHATDSHYLVPFDGKLKIADCPTAPPEDAPGAKKVKKQLERANRELRDLQKVLYAHDRFSLLLVFQALDAAGKDSTIRAVLSGVNLAGVLLIIGLMPFVLRHLWDTVALGAGELRERLLKLCRDQGVRCRQVLLWRTHGLMLNGAVIGGAAELSLACDFRIGVDDMKLMVPAARIGIHYEPAGLRRIRWCGRRRGAGRCGPLPSG